MIVDAEFIQAPRNPSRAIRLLRTLAKFNHGQVVENPTYKKEFLFIWGPGGVTQRQIAKRQHQAGGQVVFFDLGYFGRSGDSRTGGIRMSFNETHPQKYFEIAPNDRGRFSRFNHKVETLYDPQGPIVLIGLGQKSRQLYGYDGLAWEVEQIEKIRKVFPDKEVVFRAKPRPNQRHEVLTGTINKNDGRIEQVLHGASLVVCRHSNVAVDAAIAGVPCVCYDGIGVKLWSQDIENIYIPTREERIDFLSRVAWFNWFIPEAPKLLGFVKDHAAKIREVAETKGISSL